MPVRNNTNNRLADLGKAGGLFVRNLFSDKILFKIAEAEQAYADTQEGSRDGSGDPCFCKW